MRPSTLGGHLEVFTWEWKNDHSQERRTLCKGAWCGHWKVLVKVDSRV